MLKCEKIVKKYMMRTAVNDVSFDLEVGRIYALLGPNGSGKTTIMKMISGLVKPTEGNILFHDKPIGIESKKHVAYMSTEPFYYSYMTIKDVGSYHRDFFGDFDINRYYALIERMELSQKDKVKSLSSGMSAKLKIAATLARKAELYLLDEPLNGIDIIARDRIITTILENTGEKNTLVLSSHLVDELEKIIDHAIFIKQGELILNGEAEKLREEKGKSIVELYKEIYG